MDGWDWFWGAIMMLLFWGVPAALIVLAVRAFGTRSQHDAGTAEDPQTILESRFAKGEISEEEFEDRKRVLASHV
jgi:putative membrane protein